MKKLELLAKDEKYWKYKLHRVLLYLRLRYHGRLPFSVLLQARQLPGPVGTQGHSSNKAEEEEEEEKKLELVI